MSFCPQCGKPFAGPVNPAAKCPSCGWLPGTPLSLGATTARPSRFKIDLAIALAVMVLLLFLWRLKTRPEILGAGGSILVTNIFGPFGLRLAQNFGGSDSRGNSPVTPPHPSISGTNRMPANHFIISTPPLPARAKSNEFHGPSPVVFDDTLITNVPVKSMVTSLEVEPSPTSPDAGAMAQRLGAVGAKGGDIQFSLSWDNFNDLDLHCIDPRGVEIWFENTFSLATGGQLDHDANARDYVSTPVENIFWPSGGAPAGIYQLFVVYYANHGSPDPAPFTVRTIVRNQTNYFTSYISYADSQQRYWICSIQYDPSNPDPAKRRRFLNPGPEWTNYR